MLWPTTPVVQRPTADPKMQQIAEMLWEKLKRDPAFEALEAQECASKEVYLPEVQMDFCGYLPSNQTMDRAVNMNLPEDLGAREEKLLYMTLPANVRKGGVVLLQYPQQKDLNKLLQCMSQTALHDVHLPISVHKLIAEYSRSPFFKGIYRYLTTQQTHLSRQVDQEFHAGAGREYVMISGLMFHVVWPTKEHRFPKVHLCIPEKYVPRGTGGRSPRCEQNVSHNPAALLVSKNVRHHHYIHQVVPQVSGSKGTCKIAHCIICKDSGQLLPI